MLTEVLKELGLSPSETAVYLALLQQKAIRPGVLAKRLGLPRTTVQNILLRLERNSLAMPVKEDRLLSYCAEHPSNLLTRVERQRTETLAKFERTEEELKRVIPQILGMMHSAKSIPQVRFFRGLEGAREVLFDTLSSRTELKDFANIDAMFEVVKEVNDAYVAQRERSEITKRSLLLDTPFARKVYESGNYSPRSHKGYKWIPPNLYPFSIEMNIYDGKISYLTYVKEEIIGVIVENEYIYQMHDSMWNLLWDMLPAPRARAKETKGSRKNRACV